MSTNIYIYSKEKYPRPLDKNGEFSDTPYFITVPNNSYLDSISKLFPAFDNVTMLTSITLFSYPKYENSEMIETSIDEYKIAGIIPLDDVEKIVDGEIVFKQTYQDKLDADALYAAKVSKITEMENYKAVYRESKDIVFTYNEVDYLHGIREKDTNNISSAIIILNEIKTSLGIDNTIVPWGFKNQQTVELMRDDIVKLGTLVQMTVAKVFNVRATIISEVSALTSIDAVNNYDVKTKFDII